MGKGFRRNVAETLQNVSPGRITWERPKARPRHSRGPQNRGIAPQSFLAQCPPEPSLCFFPLISGTGGCLFLGRWVLWLLSVPWGSLGSGLRIPAFAMPSPLGIGWAKSPGMIPGAAGRALTGPFRTEQPAHCHSCGRKAGDGSPGGRGCRRFGHRWCWKTGRGRFPSP